MRDDAVSDGETNAIPAAVGAVVNPVSGDGRGGAMLGTLRDCLGTHVDATVTDAPGEAPAVARTYLDRELLVVVGGDGTLGEVTDALAREDAPPLFVVPAGRGNSAYRHLYGDTDWRAIARRLGRAFESRPADLGHYDADGRTRHFVLGFSGGLFRDSVEAAESFGFLPGPLAYLLGTGRAVLGNEPVAVRLSSAGETLFDGEARVVAFGGGRYRGNAFDLFPESRPADGRLHAVVIEPTGLREAVAITRAASEGRHVDHTAVHYHRAESFDLVAPERLPVEVDGGVLPQPVREAHLEVVPGAVSFAYPKGF